MRKWKTLKKKIVYQNNFLKLREDDVLDPNHNKTKRNVIEVGDGSVIVVAIKKNNQFYLVGQPRYAVDQYSWEFVSGGIKQKENPLVAAKRELFEELSLRADKWRQIFTFHPNNSLMNRVTYVFIAEGLNKRDNTEKDSYERLTVRTVTEKNLIKEIRDGKIQDALTIVALFSYLVKKRISF